MQTSIFLFILLRRCLKLWGMAKKTVFLVVYSCKEAKDLVTAHQALMGDRALSTDEAHLSNNLTEEQSCAWSGEAWSSLTYCLYSWNYLILLLPFASVNLLPSSPSVNPERVGASGPISAAADQTLRRRSVNINVLVAFDIFSTQPMMLWVTEDVRYLLFL